MRYTEIIKKHTLQFIFTDQTSTSMVQTEKERDNRPKFSCNKLALHMHVHTQARKHACTHAHVFTNYVWIWTALLLQVCEMQIMRRLE